MNALQAIILGIVQGATEFFPISSSGHLVLVPWTLGWPEPGVLFDTVLHWGTLLAVVVYFAADLWVLIRAWFGSLVQRKIATAEARIAWLIIIATIPAAVIGYLFESYFEQLFSSPVAVGVFLAMTGLILAVGEVFYQRIRKRATPRVSDALVIGLAQAAAIAPGLSRSGLTITAGMFRGMKREAAARFSFILSVPIILGAGLAQIVKALGESATTGWFPLVLGFAGAAMAGYIAIHFLLQLVQRRPLWVFAIYCWIVAAAVLVANVL
jgi:undecaprenyl-diphosphatase